MKTTKQVLVFAFIFFAVLFLFSEVYSQTGRMKDKFYIGGITDGYYFYGTPNSPGRMDLFKELSFNTNHSFGSREKYDTFLGGFYNDISDYRANVWNILNYWNNSSNNLGQSLLCERGKIIWPCYGQRSTYQAEDCGTWRTVQGKPAYGYDYTDYPNHDVNDNWQGVTQRVKHCSNQSPYYDEPGYMVRGLVENCQQVNWYKNSGMDDYTYSDRKDTSFRWYVKPRMRIDSNFAKSNPNTPVVAIITKRFDGTRIDSVVIYCKNFIKLESGNYNYNGRYIETYYLNYTDSTDKRYLSFKGDSIFSGGAPASFLYSQVDYQVYWFGQADVWLDYVRLDDERAHFLFYDPNDELPLSINSYHFHEKIRDEVEEFSNTGGFGYFFLDEFGFNSSECIAEVNRLIKQGNPAISFTGNPNSGLVITSCEGCINYLGALRYYNNFSIMQYLKDIGAIDNIFNADIYPIEDSVLLPSNVILPDKQEFPGTIRYRNAPNNTVYNDLLNRWMERKNYMNAYRSSASFSKTNNLPFALTAQVHNWEYNYSLGTNPDAVSHAPREPLTEEISLQTYLGLAYGARIILYFEFISWKSADSLGNQFYNWGLTELQNKSQNIYTNEKRINSYYKYNGGSDTLKKWAGIVKLDSTLMKVGKYMYDDNHLIYNMTHTVNKDGASVEYIQDIKSIFRDASLNYVDGPTCINCDPENKRYWEIGFFNTSTQNDLGKYFLAVNKRCTPEISDGDGDLRNLRIKFDPDQLTGFNNWKLTEVISGENVVFDKNLIQYVNTGEFKPGEGKLFKLVPVMQSGGNLVCNESFSGQTFTNDSMVYGNGYDITIGGSNTISFKNIGGINMNGGSFKCGTKFSYQAVTLQGASYWNGLELNGCDTITIQNTTVKDIPYDSPVHLYGININDGNNITIKNNTFNNNSNAGFININFINTFVNTPTYIISNNIIGDYCSEGYCVNSNGGPQSQVYLQNNYFNSTGGGSGILLNNIAGGVLSGNVIYNCYFGINLMSSSVDVYGNTIINNDNSKGINSLSESTVNLSPSQSESGTEYVGGNNNISNLSSESNNIYVDNSYFYVDLGNNSFTIANENTNHLSGWFPQADDCGEDATIKARYNCFYLDGNLVPKSNVTCGENGNLIDFDFYSQNPTCQAVNDQFDVIALAEDIYDSIPVKLGGNGGGLGSYKQGQAMSIQSSSFFKGLKDTIIINMRKHNYDLVITKSSQLLTLFPDSTFSIDALSKLYYANLKLDNNGNKIGPLKTYFETLILNNPGNFSLIKRANYFIQKCKVVLKQYTSALQGFQEIINQNPYSFEGLVASWDYAATTLLANSSGGIKDALQLNNNETSEESNVLLYSMIDTLRNRKVNAGTYTTDDFDKKVFTKKDRETLQNSVEGMYKNERTKQINKLQELEKKSKSDNESISKKSKSELKIMKTLGEVVKVKKPNTMSEHIKNVRKDISKVLVVEKPSGNSKNKLIPQDYSLSQNYPNPFNPNTKINYELPKDGKVRLVIYDILGRQIKSLVNNEFKTAGRYTVEFNGSQFASGVYFYRIQVEGGKGFTAVKKMVLLK